jgi:CRP-like cAMP-binding protein
VIEGEDVIVRLRKVHFLRELDDDTLADVAARSRRARYAPGECVFGELEAGADVFVVLSGTAEISVEGRAGERRVLGSVSPGGAFGEMSSITGELRSATATARDALEVLVIDDDAFDRLRERRPQIAVALMTALAARLAENERRIDAILSRSDASDAQAPHEPRRTGSITRLFRELVADRQRDITFLALLGFVGALVGVRAVLHVAFAHDLAPRAILRAAYVSGFALVGLASCAAVLSNRPRLRRLLAVAYGAGAALVLNELGVTLAFDMFYRDVYTADTSVTFDVERLYRRTEPLIALVVGFLTLVQAVYLRAFYQRLGLALAARVRRAMTRRR